MALCCPPGHGCNAPNGDEPCVLDLFRAHAREERAAAVVLERWSALGEACRHGAGGAERRFRQRSYERARDRTLGPMLLGSRRLRAGGRSRRRTPRQRLSRLMPRGGRRRGAEDVR